MQYPPGPPGLPPGMPPPHLRRKDTPWWVVLLYVMGGLVGIAALGVIAFFGLVAFACGKH